MRCVLQKHIFTDLHCNHTKRRIGEKEGLAEGPPLKTNPSFGMTKPKTLFCSARLIYAISAQVPMYNVRDYWTHEWILLIYEYTLGRIAITQQEWATTKNYAPTSGSMKISTKFLKSYIFHVVFCFHTLSYLLEFFLTENMKFI